jgi:hypothetical protein
MENKNILKDGIVKEYILEIYFTNIMELVRIYCRNIFLSYILEIYFRVMCDRPRRHLA